MWIECFTLELIMDLLNHSDGQVREAGMLLFRQRHHGHSPAQRVHRTSLSMTTKKRGG